MLSSELEYCLNEAFQQARSNRHEYMTVEHLLLAMNARLDVGSEELLGALKDALLQFGIELADSFLSLLALF